MYIYIYAKMIEPGQKLHLLTEPVDRFTHVRCAEAVAVCQQMRLVHRGPRAAQALGGLFNGHNHHRRGAFAFVGNQRKGPEANGAPCLGARDWGRGFLHQLPENANPIPHEISLGFPQVD